MTDFQATRALLLLRQGTLFIDAGGAALSETCMQAFDINMARAGYAISCDLRTRLQTLPPDELTQLQAWAGKVLLSRVGGNQQFTPLFRRFPDDVPNDTFDLWCSKVLTHFMQAEDQPCLHCRRSGTTHVLNPCRHVVCDGCFDGANYAACPVCERAVDRASAFFKGAPAWRQPVENVKFKLLHLGPSLEAAARDLFASLCARKQVMSPVDKEDYLVIVRDYRSQVLDWLPAAITVRENVALLFGTLLQLCEPALVLQAAARYMNTATDVLRLIAAYSGADPALQGQLVYRQFNLEQARPLARFRAWFALVQKVPADTRLTVALQVSRFKVARLGRPLRRALLGFLDGLAPDALTEDMLRHRSYWVWMGEFLHPGEYRKRFPNVALAFQIIRKKGLDGMRAPPFLTYNAKLEQAANGSDAPALTRLLAQRPGELARRIDHALRVAGSDAHAFDALLRVFEASIARFATPVLLTLRAFMPTRAAPVAARIFWPKGGTSQAIFKSDRRPALPADAIGRVVLAAETELLRRFAQLPPFQDFIIDTALRHVIAPFNERTASKSALQLPRGSTLDIGYGKHVRLFLHWCEPRLGGKETDLDLSVGFYDAQWQHQGTCSYYQLKLQTPDGDTIATSAGDLRDAPYPDGASEFIDIDRQLAARHGIRYAVAVVNNYSGSSFGELERAYAGLMLRDDLKGGHFDPRTVALKFELQGGGGIFMPMVFDMVNDTIHWLDVYSRGELEFNNVVSSNSAITAICPAMLGYFGSGVRTSMFDIGLLHAAARGARVTLRGDGAATFARAPDEDSAAFLGRLRGGGPGDAGVSAPALDAPVFALLLDGDLALAAGSKAYVLKPGVTSGTVAGSDMIS